MTRRILLAVLALALVAPAALASVPRSSSAAALGASELAPPSRSLERALATDDDVDGSSRFALFAGDELRPQLTVFEPSYPETRVGAFDFLGSPLVGVSSGVSHELHWGCGDSRLGTPEGIGKFLSEDPAGDLASPSKYAYVGWQPNIHTDPTGELPPLVAAGLVLAAKGAISVGIGATLNCTLGPCDYSWRDAGIDFGLGTIPFGESLGKARYLAKLGPVARFGVRAAGELGYLTGAEVLRNEWTGRPYDTGSLATGAIANLAISRTFGAALGIGRWASGRFAESDSTLGQFLARDISTLRWNGASGRFVDATTGRYIASPLTPLRGAVRRMGRTLNPLNYTSSRVKGILGREISRWRAFARGEELIGRELSYRVDGIELRADLLTRTRTGRFRIIESKLGPFSGLTEHQADAFPILRITGQAEFFGPRADRALSRIGVGMELGDVDLVLETFFGSGASF